jgi:hypothetical protein
VDDCGDLDVNVDLYKAQMLSAMDRQENARVGDLKLFVKSGTVYFNRSKLICNSCTIFMIPIHCELEIDYLKVFFWAGS